LIYDNAEARIISQTVGERFKLKFKYERVRKAQLTLLGTDKPRLIMQADTEQIVVYELNDG
jgi:hypothetical protein